MKIHIPTKQEKEKKTQNVDELSKTEEDLTETYATTSSGISTNNQKTENTRNSKVNINTATQTQLETLPGIGPSTAIKILTYRKEKGKFKKIDDIKEVSGIGDSKFEKIKDYIRVD